MGGSGVWGGAPAGSGAEPQRGAGRSPAKKIFAILKHFCAQKWDQSSLAACNAAKKWSSLDALLLFSSAAAQLLLLRPLPLRAHASSPAGMICARATPASAPYYQSCCVVHHYDTRSLLCASSCAQAQCSAAQRRLTLTGVNDFSDVQTSKTTQILRQLA